MKTDEKLKVLQVINSLSVGGAEKLVVDISKSLKDSTINNKVLVLQYTDSFLQQQIEEQSEDDLEYLTRGSVYNPFLIFRLIKFLKRFDVIHMHLFPTLYWVVFASFFISKPRLIYTEHSTENRRRRIYLFKLLDRIIYKRLNVVTCITQSTKENLVNHIGYDNNFKIVNNGIFIDDYYDKAADYDFLKDTFRLIQVSSFREQKDQMTLLKAMTLLPENISLILVGEGELKGDCINYCKLNNLENRVLFLGARKDVPELLNYADITILSSHYEGFGLAILEGMAAGKPALASNVKGVKEIVNGYGLLFEKGDYSELASLILKLKNDKLFYETISKKCFERAQDYDINFMISKLVEIYKDQVL